MSRLFSSIEAIVLMEVLSGRDATAPNRATLETAADIELDSVQDRIWVIVEHRGDGVGHPVDESPAQPMK